MYTSVGAVGGEIKKKKEKVTALKGEGTTTTSNNCLYIKKLDFFTEIQFVHVQCVKKKNRFSFSGEESHFSLTIKRVGRKPQENMSYYISRAQSIFQKHFQTFFPPQRCLETRIEIRSRGWECTETEDFWTG